MWNGGMVARVRQPFPLAMSIPYLRPFFLEGKNVRIGRKVLAFRELCCTHRVDLTGQCGNSQSCIQRKEKKQHLIPSHLPTFL